MGVASGITITELTPRRPAAHATPWAWLPEDAAITPLFFSSSEREKILLYAPLTLKEPVFWRFGVDDWRGVYDRLYPFKGLFYESKQTDLHGSILTFLTNEQSTR
jgi:hypothetical protein